MKKINNLIPNQKAIFKKTAMGVSFLVSAVYITKKHVDRYEKNDKINRQKMFNKMVGFIGGFGLSIIGAHRILKSDKNSILKQSAFIVSVIVATFICLWTAKKINKKLYD